MSRRINPQLIAHLVAWGKHTTAPVRGLGFPSLTPEARLRESPGHSTVPNKGPYYWPNPLAQAVDQAVRDIALQHQLALYCQYVYQYAVERSAVICNVREIKFGDLMVKAQEEVADRLGIRMWVRC